jgi:hypothetical protein
MQKTRIYYSGNTKAIFNSGLLINPKQMTTEQDTKSNCFIIDLYIYVIDRIKQMTNQQDLIFLNRIIILIASMLILSLLTLMLWIYHLFTSYS